VERGKAIYKEGQETLDDYCEKIHEFSLPETIRTVGAVKIMNFPDLKYFHVFTFFIFCLKVIQVYPQKIQ